GGHYVKVDSFEGLVFEKRLFGLKKALFQAIMKSDSGYFGQLWVNMPDPTITLVRPRKVTIGETMLNPHCSSKRLIPPREG
ncbi:MAG: hypothetical protein PHQ23_13105, partial [Candidatus Wallbacteria bacterium]|nr:hypothetical protein [Candidatus Wallbacteria bacterium]